jgi:hypothetical protein
VVPGSDQSVPVSSCIVTDIGSTYALKVIQGVELRAQTAMYTQELLVHDRGQRQSAEGVHAGFVDGLGILVLAFELECEVISQMSAFVVAAEQPERVRVPDLQRP